MIRTITETSEQFLGEVEYFTTYESWNVLNPCACRLMQPNEGPCPPTSCPTNTVTNSEAIQRCWQANGSISLDASTALIGALLGKLGISIDIGGNLSGCVTVTNTSRWTIPATQCTARKHRIAKTKKQVVGHLNTTKHCEWWTRVRDVDAWVWVSPCGTSECEYVSTTASAWDQYQISLQQAPFACQPATQTPPDEYDNERELPCCHPFPGCDENADPPCCGCVTEQ